jgi:hypothetical protein
LTVALDTRSFFKGIYGRIFEKEKEEDLENVNNRLIALATEHKLQKEEKSLFKYLRIDLKANQKQSGSENYLKG